MKKLHIESDIVLQSEQGSIRILTKNKGLTVHFEDWNTVSAFFESAKGSFYNPKRLLGLSKNLDQHVSIEIADKPAITIYDGKIDQWKFMATIKLFIFWFRGK
ncbi:MAG: hypothetical protein WBG42_15985 [Cryomorphaceae bacterium]